MMFLVKKTFRDKETKALHQEGTLYNTVNENRAEELKDKGFLGSEVYIGVDLASEKEETTEDKLSVEESPNKELTKEESKRKKKGDK